ncbi:hypothetical protein OHA37_02340 [Streptomyces sp. NBC_00335]|uniref:hypothetical protein n=1 Tax=unclassified Streptomyces TaxID=2593676 RepID=UPI00224E15E1|nr:MULTISPECIES: hypothetical protein [unclassified Streptomyces]MCX5402722.1 hypothetical protein [Streptomyces sp. NBC_00086]
MTDDAANEPHIPSDAERAARARVREQATGLTHHQTQEALEAAEAAAVEASGDLEGADAATRAAVAEWRRITELLFDHGGPYSPDTDAFVQGQLTAREAHADSKQSLGKS